VKTLIWIIAIVVLQGIFAAAAKKAKANQAKAAGGAAGAAAGALRPKKVPSPSNSALPSAAPAATAAPVEVRASTGVRAGSRVAGGAKPVVLARGGETPRGSVATPRGSSGTHAVGAAKKPAPAVVRQGGAEPKFAGRSVRAVNTEPVSKKVTKPVSPAKRPAPPATGLGAKSSRAPSPVATSVARVQAAEARITGLAGVEIATPMTARASDSAAASAATRGFAAAIRNRDEVRRAVLLSEVLGAPRAMRPYGA
jgi:hypothetical protein